MLRGHTVEDCLSVMGEVTGGIRERKGRDKINPSLAVPPLYKGFSGNHGRVGPKKLCIVMLTTNIIHSGSYRCLATLVPMPCMSVRDASYRGIESISMRVNRHPLLSWKASEPVPDFVDFNISLLLNFRKHR